MEGVKEGVKVIVGVSVITSVKVLLAVQDHVTVGVKVGVLVVVQVLLNVGVFVYVQVEAGVNEAQGAILTNSSGDLPVTYKFPWESRETPVGCIPGPQVWL